ncbi:MAG: hypothetical protein Q8K64_09305 [Sediminibacterium sp.]|nr:hypothetical protein [Sediminibacterium sp.]
MELDDLKTLLNQKLSTDHLYLSEADIATMLTKKANSVLSKIKKSIWFEIFSCIIIIIGFGYLGIFSKYSSLNIYFSTFTLMFFIFTFVLIYLLKKINQFDEGIGSIKTNLQSIVNLLEEFIKRYFQFTMALIPICFVFAFLLGFYQKEPVPELDALVGKKQISKSLLIGFAVGYLSFFAIASYKFTKWYLKKLYGNYVNELKVYIAELKDPT